VNNLTLDIKAGSGGGFLLPRFLSCPECKGDGRRWRFLFWRFGTCRTCKGDGLDRVTAIERIREGFMKTRGIKRGKT
jgi:hypothetical protein